jgi:hypothetical protein
MQLERAGFVVVKRSAEIEELVRSGHRAFGGIHERALLLQNRRASVKQ